MQVYFVQAPPERWELVTTGLWRQKLVQVVFSVVRKVKATEEEELVILCSKTKVSQGVQLKNVTSDLNYCTLIGKVFSFTLTNKSSVKG